MKELIAKWRKVASLQDDEWGVDGNDYRACADELEAALAAQPNPTIVNAVRLAYYTGDFKGAIDVIAEAVGENVLVSGQLPKEGGA